MTRGKFFQSILGLVGLQQASNVMKSDCHNTLGVLCEGEEYCPAGHAQKSLVQYGKLVTGGSTIPSEDPFYGYPPASWPGLNVRVCATCGIVYIKREKTQ